jgi:hypothetical protein
VEPTPPVVDPGDSSEDPPTPPAPPPIVPVFATEILYDFNQVNSFTEFLAKVATIPGATTTMTHWTSQYGGDTHGVFNQVETGYGEILIPLPSTHNKFILNFEGIVGIYWAAPPYSHGNIEISLNGVQIYLKRGPGQVVIERNYNVGDILSIRENLNEVLGKNLRLRIQHVASATQ